MKMQEMGSLFWVKTSPRWGRNYPGQVRLACDLPGIKIAAQ
jgi:hypothetical protein